MLIALVVLVVVLFIVLPLAGMALWALFWTALVGLVIGALGRLVVPGSQPIGAVATVLLGLAGAVVGGLIGHLAHIGHVLTFLVEVGTAALLVAGYSARGRRSQLGPGTR